ncbi:MAG: DEAD/DEAH box helicase [Bacteroidota bacterium]
MYKLKSKKRYSRRNKPVRKFSKEKIDIHKFIRKSQEKKAQVEAPYEVTRFFKDFPLRPKLLKQIDGIGYEKPTEIQDKTLETILEERDVIGIAGTGTGKTAAFLIPIIQQLLIGGAPDQYALVITPTRELANQISDEFRKITRKMRLFSTSLIGGIQVDRSIRELRRTNHIIIATPGRLADMVKRKQLSLNNFKVLVLDEFDRMLDMGFKDEVLSFIDAMSERQQTLLFSATLDDSQKKIIQSITQDALVVKAGTGTQNTSAIQQEVREVPKGKNKLAILMELIQEAEGQKVILFCETKRSVEQVCRALQKSDIQADMIHGDKTQKARESALRNLKKGRIQVLVATDVLARGIDVQEVAMVINYEVPSNYNDYIHRIGRTGRAGKSGKAITLID